MWLAYGVKLTDCQQKYYENQPRLLTRINDDN